MSDSAQSNTGGREPEKIFAREITIETPTVEYPEGLCFWKTDISDDQKIVVINEADLPLDRHYAGLGIANSRLRGSFGICDPVEARKRLDHTLFLIRNPEVQRFFRTSSSDFELPTSEFSFLKWANSENPHNPYWTLVRNTIETIRSAETDSPAAFRALADTLEKSLPLEEAERQVDAVLADRIQTVAVIDGILSFVIEQSSDSKRFRSEQEQIEAAGDGEEENPKTERRFYPVRDLTYLEGFVCGHQLYSLGLDKLERITYPKWTKNPWDPRNWVGIGNLVRNRVERDNETAKTEAMKEMVIDEPTEGLIKDIKAGLCDILNTIPWSEGMVSGAHVKVRVSYSAFGLSLIVVNMKARTPQDDRYYTFRVTDSSFAGYDAKMKDQFAVAEKEFKNSSLKAEGGLKTGQLFQEISRADHSLLGQIRHVPSPMCNQEHRFYAIENMRAHPALAPTVEAMRKHREFLSELWGEIFGIAGIAEQLTKTAEEVGGEICDPTVVSNGEEVIGFEELYPVHLRACDWFKGDLQPIHGLEEIRGGIVYLSGDHGGGKTVTMDTIFCTVHQAMSGIPVIGKGFAYTPKKVMAVVCLEGKEKHGSTFETIAFKTHDVIVETSKCPINALVGFDEIGGGTQECSGVEVGMDILRTMKYHGITTICNGQAIALAERARAELGAKCYKVDGRHHITSGIGDGNVPAVLKRTKLDQVLVK